MTDRMRTITRKTAPWLTAGILLQAGGCANNDLLAGWATSVAGSLIQTLVFGSFGLA